MFESFEEGTSRRDVLRASAIGVGASLGLVGTASAAGDDVVSFDEPLTVTADDSGTTFRQTADFDAGGGIGVDIGPDVENVTVDGNGYTISGGSVRGSGFEGGISDITVQNLHLPDGGFDFDYLGGGVVRNNVAEGVYFAHSHRVRVANNTFDGGIQTVENTSDTVFWRNVAPRIRLWGDVSGSHRITDNVVTGPESGPGIDIQQGTPDQAKVTCLGNHVANAASHGIDTLDVDPMTVHVHRNTVVGNGGHGLESERTTVDARENSFIGNGGDGVHGSLGTFRRNTAASNDGDGFSFSRFDGDGDCLRNAAVANGGAGFRFRASELRARGPEDMTVKFNRSTGNDGDGAVFEGAVGNVFRKNRVTANDGNGLVLVDSDDNSVTRNWLCGNGGEELVVDDESTGNGFAKNLVY